MPTTKPIGFRPNEEDQRILAERAQAGETPTDTLRRGLRLLDHELWLDRARADAAAAREENLNATPDAW